MQRLDKLLSEAGVASRRELKAIIRAGRVQVNGKTVLNAMELHRYDVISIGSTKLLFIGLCGEKFRWEGK